MTIIQNKVAKFKVFWRVCENINKFDTFFSKNFGDK